MKPRILWNSKDHPDLNSGYGIVSRYMLPRLGARYGKENILIYAPIYQRDHVGEWEGMTVLPGKEWSYGESLILEHYQHLGCNLLLMVGDAWPLGIVPDLAAEDKVLWISWLPVDWLGMPKNITYRIKPAYKLVPFSKYGEQALRRAGLPNVEPAIWLGLNTDLWQPGPRDPEIMDLLGYSEDSFNILIVAANQVRKQVRGALEAIATFRKVHPEADPRLYLHSQQVGERDLKADADELGLAEITAYPAPYLMTRGGASESEMVKVFRCADVVLNACMEGFGYAQLQAQALGVPVICLSEGTGPELVVFGVEVPTLGFDTSPHQMTQPWPNPVAMAGALEEIWQRRIKHGAPLRSPNAVQFVRDNFGWDKIAEQWFGVIDRAMDDRVKYCMQIPKPSRELALRAQKRVDL